MHKRECHLARPQFALAGGSAAVQRYLQLAVVPEASRSADA